MLYQVQYTDPDKLYHFLKEVDALMVPGAKSFDKYIKGIYISYMSKYAKYYEKVIIPNVHMLSDMVEDANCQTISIFFNQDDDMRKEVLTKYLCEYCGCLVDSIKETLAKQGYITCNIKSKESPDFIGIIIKDGVITNKITPSLIFQLSMFGGELS